MDADTLYAAYGIVHGILSNTFDGASYRITMTDTRLLVSIHLAWDQEVAPYRAKVAEAITSASLALGAYVPFTIYRKTTMSNESPVTVYTSP